MVLTYTYGCKEDHSIVPSNLPNPFDDGFWFQLSFCLRLEKLANDSGSCGSLLLHKDERTFFLTRDRFFKERGGLEGTLSYYLCCCGVILPVRVLDSLKDKVIHCVYSMLNAADDKNAKRVWPIAVNVVGTTFQIPGESDDEAIARALSEATAGENDNPMLVLKTLKAGHLRKNITMKGLEKSTPDDLRRARRLWRSRMRQLLRDRARRLWRARKRQLREDKVVGELRQVVPGLHRKQFEGLDHLSEDEAIAESMELLERMTLEHTSERRLPVRQARTRRLLRLQRNQSPY